MKTCRLKSGNTMTDNDNPIEDVETKEIDVFAFRCGSCGGRAVPVEGFDTDCPHCDGNLTERTTETYTITVSVEQFKEYADCVIAH